VHVHEAIHELEIVEAANGYKMGGHAENAKTHLRAAEDELHLAVEAVKSE
jgi:hypothetical protein